ncbi:hypothetical protein BJX63DRAFT_395389 [Aspergillus granulosus]|uniref:Uncharacterized protein n=1 Tax=Aspergillus granulosus TaxID=176169 RepID=A0ABR4HBY2_9EURO
MNATKLSRMIGITAQIQRLTCMCLLTMHQAFASATATQPAGELSGPVRAERASDPFSWVEYYRISWAILELRHLSDLKTMAHGRWNWSAESLHDLDRLVSWNRLHSISAEQIWTVATVLADDLGP